MKIPLASHRLASQSTQKSSLEMKTFPSTMSAKKTKMNLLIDLQRQTLNITQQTLQTVQQLVEVEMERLKVDKERLAIERIRLSISAGKANIQIIEEENES